MDSFDDLISYYGAADPRANTFGARGTAGTIDPEKLMQAFGLAPVQHSNATNRQIAQPPNMYGANVNMGGGGGVLGTLGSLLNSGTARDLLGPVVNQGAGAAVDWFNDLFRPSAGTAGGDPLGTGATANTSADITRPIETTPTLDPDTMFGNTDVNFPSDIGFPPEGGPYEIPDFGSMFDVPTTVDPDLISMIAPDTTDMAGDLFGDIFGSIF